MTTIFKCCQKPVGVLPNGNRITCTLVQEHAGPCFNEPMGRTRCGDCLGLGVVPIAGMSMSQEQCLACRGEGWR